MSPDIEDLLRDQLRGAASGAPHHLGVDDQDVLARGRRVELPTLTDPALRAPAAEPPAPRID